MIPPEIQHIRDLIVEMSHLQCNPDYDDPKRGLPLRARHLEIQQEIGENGEEWLSFFWEIYMSALCIVDMAEQYPLAPNWATERMKDYIEGAVQVFKKGSPYGNNANNPI